MQDGWPEQGELGKSKVLKEVKLVDRLFKYKHSRLYVLQGKLRLLILREKYYSAIVEKPKTTI